MSLFEPDALAQSAVEDKRPLAERMRPANLKRVRGAGAHSRSG